MAEPHSACQTSAVHPRQGELVRVAERYTVLHAPVLHIGVPEVDGQGGGAEQRGDKQRHKHGHLARGSRSWRAPPPPHEARVGRHGSGAPAPHSHQANPAKAGSRRS